MKKQLLVFQLVLVLALVAVAQIVPINIGTNPNDGTGDTLRTAFGKVNSNFNYLYNLENNSSFESITVSGTNVGSSAGSFWNGVGMTNGSLTATGIVHRLEAGSANTLMVSNGAVNIGTNVFKASEANYKLQVNGGFYASGSIAVGVNIISGSDGYFAPSARSRWYSPADGTMNWMKNDGTMLLMANTNGVLTVPGGILVKSVGAEPVAVAGYAQFYASTPAAVTEMFVQGSDGTETQISPHADDAPSFLYDTNKIDMKQIVWREKNPFITNGMVSFINMRRMARITELNTKAILYLAGQTSAGNSNSLQKLKDMTNPQKQVIVTETFAEYNTRTGSDLKPLIWEDVQNQLQSQYDLNRIWLTQTNAIIAAEGGTNFVVVPPVADIRQPKPQWLTR